MLLPHKTKSHVNLYLVITLVNTRRIWKLGKSSLLSCLRQLKLCSFALCFDLRITSLLNPNLVTTFVCYPSFSLCLLLCNQICAMWEFWWVVCSVMVPQLAIYGAAMKPRAPMGAHTRLYYSTRAGIEVSSHDPLQNCTDVLFSRELFLGYISVSCQKICMSDQMQ